MTDRDLIARIRAGDTGAFALLFHENYEELCDYAARMLGSDAAAEELVQEGFFHLWCIREKWEITSTVHGYLRVMIRNRVLNHLRHERVERRGGGKPPAGDEDGTLLYPEPRQADDDATSNELAIAIDKAIAELPPRCRQAFLLRREQNLSYAEIARIMHTATRTVEAQIRLAHKTLRTRLSDWL